VEGETAALARRIRDPGATHDMTVNDDLAAAAPEVMRHRPRLLGLGYRMLGDVQEAEDVVQEAYLRWFQDGREDVLSPEAWLVTVVTRLSVDRLRKAQTSRISYVGPWLPEPVATEPPPDAGTEQASDLSIAMLMLLERLAPEERAIFLLRDVFDAEYGEIARIMGRSEPSVRQAVHRARERVRGGRTRFAAPADVQGELLRRFREALAADDREAVLALLAPDVTFTSDGGGMVNAARNVIVGADRVMRLILGVERKFYGGTTERWIQLNGEPTLVRLHDGEIVQTVSIATDGERITAFYIVMNPHKLRGLASGPRAIE
jgi:RNA polymerase sigma-70 factor (ECF subfamily)